MNVELLRKIAAVIQDKPAEFNVEFWHARGPNYWGKLTKETTTCGTTHCIAGWAHVLSGQFPRSATMNAAPKILGLSNGQAFKLFHAENWPEEFCDPVTAESAAARIEHFIKTDGAE